MASAPPLSRFIITLLLDRLAATVRLIGGAQLISAGIPDEYLAGIYKPAPTRPLCVVADEHSL